MEKKLNYHPLYRTKCQFIASTLFTFGKRLESTEWSNNECFFIFEDSPNCEEIVKKYYTGELKADPRILFDSFKTIKSILFNN